MLILPCLLTLSAVGQDDDPCAGSEDKKATKLYEAGMNRKNSKAERFAALNEAVERDADYVAAWFELADIKTKDLRYKGLPYTAAKEYLMEVYTRCPEYHSNLSYYLGRIAMEEGSYTEAVAYLEEFYQFSSDDDDKFDRKYDEFMKNAKEAKAWAEFYMEFYENPVPFSPVKVEPVSSADNDEYLPVISPDNEYLYFTRRFEDETKAKASFIKSVEKDFVERFSKTYFDPKKRDEGTALKAPFNRERDVNYGGAALSIDNKEMYLTICKNEGGMTNCDLYSTEYVYSPRDSNATSPSWHWTPLKNMGPLINTPDGWEAQPTLSADGKHLLFASAREGSQGIDIYQSLRLPNGTWGAAERVGEPISTSRNDKTPFFHSDSKTLYYASEGHKTFGGYDVFYARMDEYGSWSDPVNMGYPINTSEDEHGFVVSLDGQYVYFTSQEKSGKKKLNIYSFKLHEKARPDRVMLVSGTLNTQDPATLKDAQVVISNPSSGEEATFDVDTVDGSYTAMISMDRKEPVNEIAIEVKGKDLAFTSFLIPVDTTEAQLKAKRSTSLKKLNRGESFPLEDITYKTSSADLDASSFVILDRFAAWLIDHPKLRVGIYGHTDNVGDSKTNLALSSDRAFSVMAYLQEQGVAGNRMEFKGYGSSKPLVSNSTASGRAKNRRTEFKIL